MWILITPLSRGAASTPVGLRSHNRVQFLGLSFSGAGANSLIHKEHILINPAFLKRPTPSHVLLGYVFLAGGIIAAVGSLVVGAKVLHFMVTTQGDWDFQGASGMATVIPGLAGIILAGWAIYHQMRVSAPSHRAAEEALMEISDFRRTYSKIASVTIGWVPAHNTEAPTTPESKDLHDRDEPTVNVNNAVGLTPKEQLENIPTTGNSASRRLQLERVASEFHFDVPHSCSTSVTCVACDSAANAGRYSFATMATKILPLLDTLQHHKEFSSEFRIDLVSTEEKIDLLGRSFKHSKDHDDGELSWCCSVVDLVYTIETLIAALHSKGLLDPGVVERALLEPKQSRDIVQFKKQLDEYRAWQKENIPTNDRATRFAGVGVIN